MSDPETPYGDQPPRLSKQAELIRLVRLLASYPCAGVGQEPDDPNVCNQCGPCEARLWVERYDHGT